jgi:hypothetical protein
MPDENIRMVRYFLLVYSRREKSFADLEKEVRAFTQKIDSSVGIRR